MRFFNKPTVDAIDIKGSTSGTVTLKVAAVAGTHTIKLPINDGSANQFIKTDAAGQWSWSHDSNFISLTATSLTAIGMAVYSNGAGTFELARAYTGSEGAIGLAISGISAAASGVIQTNGIISLTTGQWDTLCGTSGGLIAGTIYYLSSVAAGKLTSTPPTLSGGYYSQKIIRALSTTVAVIRIGDSIKL